VARRHGDFALVGVAATVSLDRDRRCRSARLALLSVGEGPVLATGAAALVGERPTGERIAEVASQVAGEDIDPPSDLHASAAYRRHLAEVLVRRCLTVAVDRGVAAVAAAEDGAAAAEDGAAAAEDGAAAAEDGGPGG